MLRGWLATCLAAVTVAGCSLEDKLLYHPTQGAPQPPPAGARWEDVELRTPDGTRIHARWCLYPGARGALLYCHGNAGNLNGRGAMVADLMQGLGVSVLIFDYPAYGRSEGSPSEAGCYAAAEAAYDWLTQTQHIPPEEILLFGKSLGGGVAVELATRRPHRALILVKTFTSVPNRARELCSYMPVRGIMHNRFDNLGKIAKCPRPVFIAHGDCDWVIPFSHGERLFAAANEPKQFLRLAGHAHTDPLPPEFFAELRQFLDNYACKGTPTQELGGR